MKKTPIAAATLFLIAGAVHAQSKSAEDKLYGEIGIHNTKLKLEGASESPSLNVGTALLGYQFHPNFSAEVMLASGLSSASYKSGEELKVNYGLGLILRPSYKFTDKFEGFARLGYAHYKLSAASGTHSASDTENSVVYGLGANYYFTDKLYGQLSYTSFYDKNAALVRGFGLSVGYKF